MAETSVQTELFRAAADELAKAADHDRVDRVAEVVTDALVDQAQHRAPAVSQSYVDGRMAALKLGLDAGASASGKPLEIVRGGARNASERALLASLVAWHVETLLQRRDGVQAVRALAGSLDWLEFVGHVAPYTAARATLDADVLARLDAVLDAAPTEAATPAAEAAVRALRGRAPVEVLAMPSTARTVVDAVSVAGELEGVERGVLRRILGTPIAAVTGPVRAVLRVVFSLRSPVTVSLDAGTLRVHGHTELLGRTLRTWDERFPLTGVAMLRRETRFPSLPVAASVFALGVGSILGAREAIEGARAQYFPLVALGLGLLAGGVFFDALMRAVFPGVQGRTRLTVRSRDGRGVVLTALPAAELDALLDAIDASSSGGARAGVSPISSATVRDDVPAPSRHGG